MIIKPTLIELGNAHQLILIGTIYKTGGTGDGQTQCQSTQGPCAAEIDD